MTDSQEEKILARVQAVVFVIALGVRLSHTYDSMLGIIDAILTGYVLASLTGALWVGIKAGLKEWNDPKYSKK
jgi:hypothetical protein